MSLDFPGLNKRPIKDFYLIGDEIGRGAFSIVVEAEQKNSHRTVAIKIVDKKNTTPKQMLDELAVIAEIKHPHIVEYLEIFNRIDGYYVVLERIYGGELFDRIIELDHYTETEASSVMLRTFHAIKYLHDIGYVHRDIKPENLLLADKESNVNIKIADFGFAAKMKENGLRAVVGTPPYMAPELVRLRTGDKSLPGYGKGVDEWSLGIILYILLSGIHPFQIDDEDEMLDNIERGTWEFLGDEWENISEEAKNLISGLMNPDPERRFTVDDAISHPWFTGGAGGRKLSSAQDQIRKFQARKKLKGAIMSVMATARLRRTLEALKLGSGIDEHVDNNEPGPNTEDN